MKTVRQILLMIPVLLGFTLLLPGVVSAQIPLFKIPNPTSFETIDEVIYVGLNTAIALAAVVAVVYLVYNGFRYMIAAGDATATQEAQKGLANALIGLVIVIISGLLVNFVMELLGVTDKAFELDSLLLLIHA